MIEPVVSKAIVVPVIVVVAVPPTYNVLKTDERDVDAFEKEMAFAVSAPVTSSVPETVTLDVNAADVPERCLLVLTEMSFGTSSSSIPEIVPETVVLFMVTPDRLFILFESAMALKFSSERC